MFLVGVSVGLLFERGDIEGRDEVINDVMIIVVMSIEFTLL